MAQYRIPGPLDASRGNHDVRDGTLQRFGGVRPGPTMGADPGNTSAWDMLVKNYRRLDAVRQAIAIGELRAGAAILRETGHAIEELIKGLIPGLLMMMVVLVATTVIGGVIGGVIGFFFGGVGAVPGAAIGAELGVSAGTTILGWLGLAFLAVGIAEGFGELVGAVAHATTRAWDAPDHARPQAEIHAAGEEYANAIALLFKIILMAIVARLMLRQTRASSKDLLDDLAKSKLGKGFAEWVAKNQEALLKNPRLRPKPKAAQSEAPVQETVTPSQAKARAPAPEPSPQPAKPKSLRERYLGRTPGKSSKTGQEVQASMRAEGKLRDAEDGTEFLASDGEWYPLKDADMAHKTDAVTWWNDVGRNYGAKSQEVRKWMLDSDNYFLDQYSLNRSAGAKLGQTYLTPTN